MDVDESKVTKAVREAMLKAVGHNEGIRGIKNE